MDYALVSSIKAKALGEMEEKGASEVTLKRYRGIFSTLEKSCGGEPYTADKGASFAEEAGSLKYPVFSRRHRRDRGRVVRMADLQHRAAEGQ